MVLNYRHFFADRFRLLKRLGISRLWNYSKIILGWQYSAISGKVVVWGYPFSLSLETASICNLSCPECLAGIKQTHRNKKLMDEKLIEEKLQLHRSTAFYCNLYAQGEPFLHPGLYSIIEKTSKSGYYSVISTNGHFLHEENCRRIISTGLDKLIISLDGLDAAAYLEYRKGGNFDKVVEGIKTLSRIRKETGKSHPLLVVQFLVHKNNEHQIKLAPKFVQQLGADVLQCKSMQIYSAEGKKNLLPQSGAFN
jgi:MoaA/NifB/PqqE/SkfB family radical SAM enzyme